MKSSLINVFATFLLLSYNRLFDISFSLLVYTTAYNPRGEAVCRYLYYDSSKKLFDEKHRLLEFLPFLYLLLLTLYPLSSCFCTQ